MTPSARAALICASLIALIASFFLPAIAFADVVYTGGALVREVVLRRDPASAGFAANLVVPALSFMRPRWPRSEFVLITALLAMAAWLTARAVAGPLQLQVGAWIWWVAMICLGAVALHARNPFGRAAE